MTELSIRYPLLKAVALLGAAGLCVGLSSCAHDEPAPVSSGAVAQSPEAAKTSAQLVSDAGYKFQAGDTQAALSLLHKAAERDPVAVEPWLRIAQVQFDAKEYGEAIVAANEVLRRDPADRTANSIISVSGLRVAANAIKALRDNQGLSGTVRSEAEALATQLRSALGEQSLVPPPDSSSKTSAKAKPKHNAVVHRTAKAKVSKSKTKPVKKPVKNKGPDTQKSKSNGQANPLDPFGALQTLPE